MPSPAAQQNTNEIFAQIALALGAREDVDEITKRRWIRDAENQVELERELALKALIYTASKERTKAKDNALEALRYLSESATLNNCYRVLQANGYSKILLDQVDLSLNYFDDPEYISSLGIVLCSFPNVLHATLILENLEKMALKNDNMDLYNFCSVIVSQAEVAADELGLDKGVYSALSKEAASVAELNGVVVNNAEMWRPDESDWMSLVYYIETDDVDQIVEMNGELTDKIIDAELDAYPVVARFEPLPPSQIKVVERYVN